MNIEELEHNKTFLKFLLVSPKSAIIHYWHIFSSFKTACFGGTNYNIACCFIFDHRGKFIFWKISAGNHGEVSNLALTQQ